MISALEVWALSGQGGAPSLFKTLEGLSRRGHEIDFVGPRIGANHHAGAPVQESPAIPGVRYHLFPMPQPQAFGRLGATLLGKIAQKLAFALLFPFLASRRAGRLAGNGSYDLLYGYEVHGVLAGRLMGGPRLPAVARFQGTVMQPFLGKPLSLWRRFEEVIALRSSAELYIMTDDGTQGDEVLAKLNPNAAGRVAFWRNGVDLEASRLPSEAESIAARAGLGIDPDELILATAVRLARWKRIDRAVTALADLRRLGHKARLLVVGDGEERANLQIQAADLGVQESVLFVGSVPQPEVQSYLWAADIFLSLNELSNVGNPLLEAMQTGRCILTLDVGDTSTLIKDGENGVLLGSSDPHDIAKAIVSLMEAPETRARLSRAARLEAEASFWTWDQRLDAEEQALTGLVAQAAGVTSPDG